MACDGPQFELLFVKMIQGGFSGDLIGNVCYHFSQLVKNKKKIFSFNFINNYH